jgi:aspartate/methionine/tyrosine aminotransferase
MFSSTVTSLRSSPIQVMAERTRQAVLAGGSVIDMTLGEPDFPTLEHGRRPWLGVRHAGIHPAVLCHL